MDSRLRAEHTVLASMLQTVSLVTLSVALIVIAAWWGEWTLLASVRSDYVPMSLSVALSVLLLSIALLVRWRWTSGRWGERISIALALAVLLISSLALMNLGGYTGLDIDKLLGAGRGTTTGYVLAQASPISTITMLVASIACVLTFGRRLLRRSRETVISALSLVVFSIGLVITLGYAYGSPLLYGGDIRPASLLSGISYALLGMALLCAQGPDKWPAREFMGPTVRARLLRSFLPLVVFVVLVSGSLSNKVLSASSNPALTISLIALLTAMTVGYVVSRLSGSIGGEIDSTNEMLRRTDEELRLANEKLSVLGSITRHDALNRLVVVLGRLEMVKTSTKDRAILKQVDGCLESAQAIKTIMQFTGEYQKIGVSGSHWIDVEDAFREAVRETNHEIVRVSSDVTGLEVLADPMFSKVLVNLVDNSIRHGEHVGIIRLYHQQREGGLALVYEDDGVGLSQEDKANLFKRGHGKHTGLGMYLSREIVVFTGLTIRETGMPGKGARFEILVPTGKFRFKGEGR